MPDAILTINAGSSSIRFALFEVGGKALSLSLSGHVEEIETSPRFRAVSSSGAVLAERRWPGQAHTHEDLLGKLIDWIERHLGADSLVAVGHRVVHGGPAHDAPARVTSEVMDALEALVPLAPLHQPHNLSPMRAIAATRPDLPQVACFDTGFHHGMPELARRFALPREYEARGVRRYGFHGLSYEYIARRLRDTVPELARGRVIVAHLGNGASLCAMRDGRSIDTTMGFSVLDGLVMGTRCGTLDPGVLLYLQQHEGMGTAEIEHLLYHRSGLLGVSGIDSDMRALLGSSDPAARAAVDLFAFRAAREAGALASSLGGLDGFVFTAGIGEHAAAVRAAICERLAWLGLDLDEGANVRGDARIGRPGSRVEVLVLPTNEEAMIARHTLDCLAL